MTQPVRIKLFGGFSLFVGNECMDPIVQKSKKGLLLLEYLILKHETVTPNHKLIEVMWPGEESTNPDNALKTLISRFRAILNQCCEGLGGCIAAGRGGYSFKLLSGMTLDLIDFEDAARFLTGRETLTDEVNERFQEVLSLYAGDLLAGGEQEEWVIARAMSLRERYIKLVYAYIGLLKDAKRMDEIVWACRLALENEPFDETLHLELMQALVKAGRNNEALIEYKHVSSLHGRYLGAKPPEGIQAFYRQIAKAGSELDMDLEAIQRDLVEYGEMNGAFECDYPVFREIYNLQMRNLERIDASLYLVVVMVTSVDGEPIEPFRLGDVMRGLSEVLKERLRKGDTMTHFSPAQYALLLPSVNLTSGRMVLERVKRYFYQRFPSSNIQLSYRIAALSAHGQAAKEE